MKKAAMWIVSLLIICGLMTGCGGSPKHKGRSSRSE